MGIFYFRPFMNIPLQLNITVPMVVNTALNDDDILAWAETIKEQRMADTARVSAEIVTLIHDANLNTKDSRLRFDGQNSGAHNAISQ